MMHVRACWRSDDLYVIARSSFLLTLQLICEWPQALEGVRKNTHGRFREFFRAGRNYYKLQPGWDRNRS